MDKSTSQNRARSGVVAKQQNGLPPQASRNGGNGHSEAAVNKAEESSVRQITKHGPSKVAVTFCPEPEKFCMHVAQSSVKHLQGPPGRKSEKNCLSCVSSDHASDVQQTPSVACGPGCSADSGISDGDCGNSERVRPTNGNPLLLSGTSFVNKSDFAWGRSSGNCESSTVIDYATVRADRHVSGSGLEFVAPGDSAGSSSVLSSAASSDNSAASTVIDRNRADNRSAAATARVCSDSVGGAPVHKVSITSSQSNLDLLSGRIPVKPADVPSRSDAGVVSLSVDSNQRSAVCSSVHSVDNGAVCLSRESGFIVENRTDAASITDTGIVCSSQPFSACSVTTTDSAIMCGSRGDVSSNVPVVALCDDDNTLQTGSNRHARSIEVAQIEKVDEQEDSDLDIGVQDKTLIENEEERAKKKKVPTATLR